jgi:hypothetical protein
MNININILEVASELAHEIVCANFADDDNAIYESTTDTITSYTEKAQDLFNEWYDYYYTFLDTRKEN